MNQHPSYLTSITDETVPMDSPAGVSRRTAGRIRRWRAAALVSGAALALCAASAAPAAASGVQQQLHYQYTTPGVYVVDVPDDATQVNWTLYGASGADANSTTSSGPYGGPGGLGGAVNGEAPVSPGGLAGPGHTLQLIVPRVGEAGAGGSDGVGARGGAGGGSAQLRDMTAGNVDLVVAGGGGGGGEAGWFYGLNGGAGGNGGSAGAAATAGGGAGGSSGQGVSCSSVSLMYGGAGKSDGGNGGAGGGGGDGWCGGTGGSSDAAAGGGGGGGGGSYTDPALGTSINSVAPSAGNGTVAITITTSDIAPKITSAGTATTYVGYDANIQLSATGSPVPTFTLTNAPSWLTISPTGRLAGVPRAPGIYRFQIVAFNHDANFLLHQTVQQFTLTVVRAGG